MSPVEWFYAQGDKQQGPVTATEIKALAESGKLKPDDLVWREGMEEWIPARRVKGLFDSEPPVSAAAPPGVAAGVPPAAPPGAGPAPPRAAPGAAPPVFEKSPAAFERAREGQARHLFDFVLEFARGQFTGHFVEATARMFAACGHYGLYLAMLVLLGFSLLMGVKGNELNPILTGLAGVALLAVLQYAAARFVGALDKLNRATAGRISSPAFLDSVCVLLGVGGVAMLLALAVQAIQTPQYLLILPAIATFILYEFMAIVALNPEALNLTVTSETTPGEEALGIGAFFIKLGIRTAPVAYGVGVVWGTIGLLYAGVLIFSPPKSDAGPPAALGAPPPWLAAAQETGRPTPRGAAAAMGEPSIATGVPLSVDFMPDALAFSPGKLELMPAAAAGTGATRTLVSFAAVPLGAYLLFLLYNLVIDAVRAVLALPGKLDRLRGEDKED